MLAVFNAHATFLLSARSSMPPESFRKTAEKHVSQLLVSLRGVPSPTLGDAASTLDAVRASCLDADLQARVVEVVNTFAFNSAPEVRTGLAPAGHASALAQQKHLFLQRYLTESDWRMLLDPDQAFGNKAKCVAERGRRIGLLSMSEKTAVAITALLILAHGRPCSMAEAYEKLQEVKHEFKQMRCHRSPTDTASCTEFPAHVEEFMAAYSDKYDPDDQPSPCKVDEGLLWSLREKLPGRATHRSLRQDSFMKMGSCSSSSSQTGSVMAALQQVIQAAMSGNSNLSLSTPVRQQTTAVPNVQPLQDVQRESPSGLLALPPPAAATPVSVEAEGVAEEKADEEEEKEVSAKPGIEHCLAAVAEAMAAKKGGKPKAKGKAKGKATAKGKAEAKAKATASPAIKGKTKAGRPAMQPLKAMPVLRYNGCSVYTSVAGRSWRVVSDANRRYDKKVPWCKGADGWNSMMEWCEENGVCEE